MRRMTRARTTVAIAIAITTAPLPALAAVPAPVPSAAAASHDDARPLAPRRLVIAGGVVGGVGLLLAAVGFGVVGGLQAALPAPGLQLGAGGTTPAQAHRVVALAHGMEAIGYTGATMAIAGATMLGVGLGLRRRHERLARLRLVPGYAAVAIAGRF